MSSDEEVDGFQSSDYEDGDSDEYQDDEFEPEAEIGAYDRVAFTGLNGNGPKTRLEKAAQEPLDKFKQSVDAIARNCRSSNKINIQDEDITKMIEFASKLDTIEHKNPSSYVLGFVVTSGGRELSDTLFNTIVKKVLPLLNSEDSVFPHDIIRYARLWQQLSKNEKSFD